MTVGHCGHELCGILSVLAYHLQSWQTPVYASIWYSLQNCKKAHNTFTISWLEDLS